MEKVCQYLTYVGRPSKVFALSAHPLNFSPTLQHLRVTVLASWRPSDPLLGVGPMSLIACDSPNTPLPHPHFVFLS